jgi:sulfatase maturation enzyme AslB (radical SAM superfamily)
MPGDTFCPIPWSHTFIDPTGDFRICCQCVYGARGYVTDGSSNIMKIQKNSINEYRNSEEIKNLRKNLISGVKDNLCKLCWDDERNGIRSKRMFMNNTYHDLENLASTHTKEDGEIDVTLFPVKYFDFRFGNLCNLKCRYCGPTDSSLWYEDYFKLTRAFQPDKEIVQFNGGRYELKQENNIVTNTTDDFDWHKNDDFWKNIRDFLYGVDRMYFTGGEPLLNKSHIKMLELCIELGVASNIYLEYNSNMTAVPDILYDHWKQFKGVHIGCSIDAIGDLANYLRNPSDWDQLEKNLDKLGYCEDKHITGSISTTINIFNIYHFIDISKWLHNKKYTNIKPIPIYHVLVGPEFMNIQILPDDIKKDITEKYEKFYSEFSDIRDYKTSFTGIFNFMNSGKYSAEKLYKLKKHTNYLDEIRKDYIKDHIQWLDNLINSHELTIGLKNL